MNSETVQACGVRRRQSNVRVFSPSKETEYED